MRILSTIPYLLICTTVVFFCIKQGENYKDNAQQLILHSALAKNKSEVLLTIFVHGSFGAALGLLSLPSVIDDNVRGSYYRQANKRIRDDEFFYKDQAILERGLMPIVPTFDHATPLQKPYAAYPITKSFETIEDWAQQQKQSSNKQNPALIAKQHHYYTFGWSGLLSQTSRRFEAIRLYNALVEEREKFEALGIKPKIRLVTHSHGGNLGLNLAAIQAVLQLEAFDGIPATLKVNNFKDAVCNAFHLMKALPAKEEAQNKIGQKRWDYVPTAKNLEIEELILYGCPIQPETVGFCCSPMFKKIYNFYSGEDVIQRIDWVTTYRHFSDQRIENSFFDHESWQQTQQKIYQVRLMIGRRWNKQEAVPATAQADKQNIVPTLETATTSTATNSTLLSTSTTALPLLKPVSTSLSVTGTGDETPAINTPPTVVSPVGPPTMSWWDMFFASKKAFSRASKDPTHKELWYCAWQKEATANTLLSPLPLMILTPLFIELAQDAGKERDLDINMRLSLDNLKIYVARHEQENIMSKRYIPRLLIEELKAKTLEWRPDGTSLSDEFNAVYRHLM